MDSNYAKYIKEREGKNIIEDEHGFATYLFQDDFVYIEDIYVVPESRKLNKASKYADEICKIAKNDGYSKAMGTVNVLAAGATRNVTVLIKYGFEITSTNDNIIYFMKSI